MQDVKDASNIVAKSVVYYFFFFLQNALDEAFPVS